MPLEPHGRAVGKPRAVPKPEPFLSARQKAAFSPKFNRLAEVLQRDPTGLELRGDPTALAPERLLVFEVRGSISIFAAAVRRIPGLELVDEEELSADDHDELPVAYLMVPDVRALRDLESLWRRWENGKLARGETPWRDVFELLRDLRPWGPADRVHSTDGDLLSQEIEGQDDDQLLALELELVFRASDAVAEVQEQEVQGAIVATGGQILSRSRIADIAYHALLVDVPVRLVREIVERSSEGISGLEPIMHIRPQSAATSIDVGDQTDAAAVPVAQELGAPILALLDGVPIANHALLNQHVVVDDQFGLEESTPVVQRFHGTAMASLIIHGDRNRAERALPKRIHMVPVLGAGDAFRPDRLIVDVIYMAILAIRGGENATAPNVLIVNLSLGNRRRPFHGQLSPWARLLDRLAYRFGILFIVSAGNNTDSFHVPDFPNRLAFEDAAGADKATGTLRAIGNIVGERRLFSPAETVNGITVGAANDDAVTPAERVAARVNIDPYPDVQLSNPSSTLGPGFAQSVKPDILMPGAREHLRVIRDQEHIEVVPAGPARSAGIKVAAPPYGGRENAEGFTNGTSAAAALASRTSHRIYDALEATYGATFSSLPHVQKAAILKALLVHPAKWPSETASLIRATIGPPEGKYHSRQKDNIRRFLGYGIVDSEEAVACAEDRATFWATSVLGRDQAVPVPIPVPVSISGQARPHALWATLAWFTPVHPGRRSYRAVRLKLVEPEEIDALRVTAHSDQPDANQANRGTVFMRCWTGDRAPIVSADTSLRLLVQREPDQGEPIDEPVSFGLAVTLTMPNIVQLYEQARQRLAIAQRAPV